jgi:xanthine dehydrogenase accessory factor
MSNAALRRTATEWLAQGRDAMVVQVLEAQGSTPREAGARMLVSAHEVQGTIGGGHLELQAIAQAREALARRDAGAAQPTERRFALGPSLGQCCGGVVTLRTSPLSAELLSQWPQPAPRFTLQLFGAGHVGRAIVRLLAEIDCRVSWIDERDAEFGALAQSLPPHIEAVCVDSVEAEVRNAPPGACYLVLTHSHDLDLRIVEQVLRRDDFGFLGLIGSATKRARFEHRLRDRGIGADTLARMTCPIGVPGIAGKEPEIVAIAAVAQLLQLRPR